MASTTGSSQGVIFNEMSVCTDQSKCTSTAQVTFLIQIPFAPDDLSVTIGGLGASGGTNNVSDGAAFDGTSFGFETCGTFGPPLQNSLALCTPPPPSAINADVVIPGDNSSITLTFAPSASSPTSSYYPSGGLTFYVVETFTLGSSLPTAPTLTVNSGHAGVTLLPAVLTFGSQTVNTTSALQSVILKNGGLTSLSIWSIAANGDFAESDNCRNSNSLAAGAICTIFVSFTPTASGSRTGTLTIGDSAPSGPQTIALSGMGDSTVVTLSAPSLAFGSQLVASGNTTPSPSAPLTVTLTNTSSSSSINVTGVSVSANPTVASSGDFNVESTSSCTNSTAVAFGAPFSGSVSVAALGTCTLVIDAQPILLGFVSGSVTVTDSVGTHILALSTVGTTPNLSLSCCSSTPPLTYASSQTDGTTSSPLSVSVGHGSTPVAIDGLMPGGGLSSDGSTTCTAGGSLPCNLEIDFSPIFPGTQTSEFFFTHSISTGLDVIASTGTGLGPMVSLTPPTLDFPAQAIATTSSTQTLTLQNTGNQPLSITGVNVTGGNSGDFQIQNNACPLSPSTLAAGSSCTVAATFTPMAAGPRKSTLSFADNAPASPQTAELAGLGSAVSLAPPSLTFSGQTTGTSSSPQTVKLTNAGSTTLNIWEITFAGINASEFSETTTCGATLAASASCNINVTFTPGGTGSRTASLWISDNGGGGLQTAALTGTGLAGPVAGGAASGNATSAPNGSVAWSGISAPFIAFGTRRVGTTSPPRAVAIKNIGTGPLDLRGVVISGSDSRDFAQTNNCKMSLPAGTTCTVQVTFHPHARGVRSAAIQVSGASSGNILKLNLTGIGSTPRESGPSTHREKANSESRSEP